jgi:hypothetical protein
MESSKVATPTPQVCSDAGGGELRPAAGGSNE